MNKNKQRYGDNNDIFELLSDLSLSTLGLFLIVFVIYALLFNSRNTILNQENSQLEQQVSEVNQENSQLEQQVSEVNQENSQLEQQVSEVNQENSQLEQQVSRVNQENSQLEQQVSRVNRKNSQLEQQVSRVNRKNSQLEQQVSRVNQENSQLEQQVSRVNRKNSQLEQQVSEVNQENSQLEQQVSRVNRKNSQLEQQVSRVNRKNSQLEQARDSAITQYREIQKEMELVLERNYYTGYYEGPYELFYSPNCNPYRRERIPGRHKQQIYYLQDSNIIVHSVTIRAPGSSPQTVMFEYQGNLRGNTFTGNITKSTMSTDGWRFCDSSTPAVIEFHDDHLELPGGETLRRRS